MQMQISPAGKRGNAGAGFTLMEMMVVMAVMAVVVGVGFGSFSFGGDAGLRGAECILEAERSARAQAAISKEPVSLILAEHSVALSAAFGGGAWRKPLPVGVSLWGVEDAHGRASAGSIIFQPRGITQASVVLLRYEGSVYSICIPSIGAGVVFTGPKTLEQCKER